MLCGNDPAARARLLPGDRAAIELFEAYLRWRALPDDVRAVTPEPVAPTTTETETES